MKRKRVRRIIAMLLAFTMVISLSGIPVYASGEGGGPSNVAEDVNGQNENKEVTEPNDPASEAEPPSDDAKSDEERMGNEAAPEAGDPSNDSKKDEGQNGNEPDPATKDPSDDSKKDKGQNGGEAAPEAEPPSDDSKKDEGQTGNDPVMEGSVVEEEDELIGGPANLPEEPIVEDDPDQLGDAPPEVIDQGFYQPMSISLLRSASRFQPLGNTIEWPNSGSINLTKEAAPVPDTPGKWEVTLKIEGINIHSTSDVVLVVDCSGSMLGKMKNTKAAAIEFVNQLLIQGSQTRIALVPFAGSVDVDNIVLFQGADDKQALIDAINGLSASGATNIQAGIHQAQILLDSSTAANKYMILLGDGEPTNSYRVTGASGITIDYTWEKHNRTWYWYPQFDFSNAAITEFNYEDLVGSGKSYFLSSNATYNMYVPAPQTDHRGNPYHGSGYLSNIGFPANHGIPTIHEAGLAKDGGTQIYSIALNAGVNGESVLDQCQDQGYYSINSSDLSALSGIFSQIAGSISYAATNGVVIDPMGDMFDLLPETIEVSQTDFDVGDDQRTITWNVGTIMQGSPATMRYVVQIKGEAQPDTLYPTNQETSFTYTDVNGDEADQTFLVPEVSTQGGSILLKGYLVNDRGEPINSQGTVVERPDLAVRLFNQSYSDSPLVFHETYTVTRPAAEGYQYVSYKWNGTSSEQETLQVNLQANAPTQTIWFAYERAPISVKSFSGVYDGLPHSIAVDNTVPEDVVYYSLTNDSDDWSTENPAFTDVTAGTAVYVKVENANYDDRLGQGTVAITARPITITAGSDSKTYDGTALTKDSYNLTDGTLASGETIQNVTVLGSQTDVGSSANVASAAEIESGKVSVSGNYAITYENGLLTVTKAAGEALDITNYSEVYDGQAHSIAVVNTVQGDAVYYRLSDSDDWSTENPAFTDVTAGTAVYVKVENANYDDRLGQGTVTITARPITITAGSDSKTYDETALTKDSYNLTDGTLASGETIQNVTVLGSQTDVGSSANVASAAEIKGGKVSVSGNYAITYENGLLTVTKAAGEALDITNYSEVYDGQAHSIAVVNRVQGDAVYYRLSDSDDWSTENPAFTDVTAGTAVYVKVESPNYDDRLGQGTVAITARPITITAGSDSKTYDGTVLTKDSYNLTDGTLASGETIQNVTVLGSQTDVGSSANVASAAEIKGGKVSVSGNYAITYETGLLTVTKATGEALNITDYSEVYDGQAHSIAVVNTVQEDIVYYRLSDSDDWSTENPAFTNVTAGTAVYVKVENPNYDDRLGQGTVAITTATITVTADFRSKTYGETDPSLTYQVSGAVGEETPAFGGSLTRTAGEIADQYDIEQGSLTLADGKGFRAGNYILTYVKAIMTITKAGAEELQITSYNGVYDGQKHSINVENIASGEPEEFSAVHVIPVKNLETGDIVYYRLSESDDWSTENPAFTNVTAETTVYVKVENPNYNDRLGQGTITITARPITITADSGSKVYDGNALTMNTYKVTAGTLVSGETIQSVTVAGSQTNVGSSANVASAAEIKSGEVSVSGNYAITYVNGALTVTSGGGGGGGGSSGGGSATIPESQVPLSDAPLNANDHFAYIEGYPDGTVRPQGNITREEVAAVFFRLLNAEYKETIRTTSESFGDVMESDWSIKHIGTLSNGKILTGYPDGSFRPTSYITRAELAAIAARFDALSVPDGNQFSDISGHWAEHYILSAAQKGWVQGYQDGTFKPDQYITRAEFVTLVNNVLNRKVQTEDILLEARQYLDLEKGAWYYDAIQEASNSHDYERMENGNEKWTKITQPIIEM